MPKNIKEELISNALYHVGLDDLDFSKPLRIKWGCDPTKPDLHLGHITIMNKLRSLQNSGCIVDVIIGDYTAVLGDPSGKKKTRPPLTQEEVQYNAHTYAEQMYFVLDPQKTVIHYNSKWLAQLRLRDILSLAQLFSVKNILSRRDFSNRLSLGLPFYLHETLYPILVAYDSTYLNTDLEIGGDDQRLNMLAGRFLLKATHKKPQAVITYPLLKGLDGRDKMSKSLNNTICFSDDYCYGKIMSMNDETMLHYYEVLDFDLDKSCTPMQLKRKLARNVITWMHDETRALEEEKLFDKEVVRKDLPVEELECDFVVGKLLRTLLAELKVLPSSSSVYRLILQNGLSSTDGNLITDPNMTMPEFDTTYRVGKTKMIRLKVRRR